MKMVSQKSKKTKAILIGIILSFCLLIAFEIWKLCIIGKTQENSIYSLISSLMGSVLFLLIIVYFSYYKILKIAIKDLARHIIFVLPCFAIAINNFPIIPYLSTKAYISATGTEILFYFLVCLSVGLFEELVFRGYIFMLILEKHKGNIKGIFASVILSSAIFGAVHLINIFVGADPLSTTLQVGYSFLIGCMCAVVLVKTSSLWYSVFLHTIYNFAGGVMPKFGGGVILDVPTIIITSILSISVAVYLIISLMRANLEATDDLMFSDKKTE